MDIITPKTTIKIPNEGFPYTEKVEIDDPENVDDKKKQVDVHKVGDLYIKFNIHFPTNLTQAQREKMVKILRNEDDE